MTIYSIGELAKRVKRSPQTLRRWEREGKITAKRLPSGHRYYDDTDLQALFGISPKEKKTIVYCRVSSAGQKADLHRQYEAMQTWALSAGIAVDEWITEVGGGMNFKRPRFLKIIDRIMRGEVAALIVAHKDRLVRFGFDLLSHICEENGCKLMVVNQESLSPQKEMVDDLLAIVHTFSCRLDGMSKYQKLIKSDFPEGTVPKTTEIS